MRLVYLLEREGGWDASVNWEDVLSLGEQQRLGMVSAKALFNRVISNEFLLEGRLLFHSFIKSKNYNLLFLQGSPILSQAEVWDS